MNIGQLHTHTQRLHKSSLCLDLDKIFDSIQFCETRKKNSFHQEGTENLNKRAAAGKCCSSFCLYTHKENGLKKTGQIFIGTAPDQKVNVPQWPCQSPDPEDTLFNINSYRLVPSR